MYSVTREPMTESDRESLRRSYGPKGETIWLRLGCAVGGALTAAACGSQVVSATGRSMWDLMVLVVFVVSVCVTVFALWTLMTWFGDRHLREAIREATSGSAKP
ncbi:MAG: hypothetical protein J0L78_01690 [Planctomycetes bacterium]|nr:hypothetical protein [Planctomycetota bacterium]